MKIFHLICVCDISRIKYGLAVQIDRAMCGVQTIQNRNIPMVWAKTTPTTTIQQRTVKKIQYSPFPMCERTEIEKEKDQILQM